MKRNRKKFATATKNNVAKKCGQKGQTVPFPVDQNSKEFEQYRTEWCKPQRLDLCDRLVLSEAAIKLYESLPKPPIDELLFRPNLPEFITIVGDDDDLMLAIFRPTVLPKAGKTYVDGATGIVTLVAPAFDIYLIDEIDGEAKVVGILIFGTSTNTRYLGGKLNIENPKFTVWQAHPEKPLEQKWVKSCQETVEVVETLAYNDFKSLKPLYVKTSGKVKVSGYWKKVKPSEKNGGKTKIWVPPYFR